MTPLRMSPNLPISAAFRTPVLTAWIGALLLLGADAAQANADAMGQWREYARRGVMPEYSWNDAPAVAAPTLLSSARQDRNARGAREALLGSPLGSLSFQRSVAPSGSPVEPLAPTRLIARDRSAIESQFVGSTFAHRFADGGRIELTAVFANQRYASAGFGISPWNAVDVMSATADTGPREFSAGHGARVAFDAPLAKTLSWNVMLQSRIDMDAFESYRGIYAEAGDFDQPARARAQLRWDAVPELSFGVGVERVFYSDIPAFSSGALPTRFLSLLGDGNSPEFAWRDLTVYTAETSVLDPTGALWTLRYSTRQQPSPTSALLARAMRDEFTDVNLGFGYQRGVGTFGLLSLAVSYSPSHYFLGATPYSLRDLDGGSQIEFEAMWSIPF
jgi:hypothetical protein